MILLAVRSPSQQSNISNVTETEELDLENDSIASSIDNITQSILTEASESATGLDISDSETYPGSSGINNLDEVDPGPEEIIRHMDRDLDDDSSASTVSTTVVSSPNGEREQTDNKPVVLQGIKLEKQQPKSAEVDKPVEQIQSKQIRIKLKYLNDDSKLVEGNLNEGIGDFKK